MLKHVGVYHSNDKIDLLSKSHLFNNTKLLSLPQTSN